MSTISPPTLRFVPAAALFLAFGLLVGVYTYFSTYAPSPPNIDYLRKNEEKKYEKSSGKNGKHSNPDARKSAEGKIEKVKEEIDRLVQKPNKTKDEARQLEKLRDQLKHLRKKKDWGGETHSRTAKGK